MKKIIIKVLKFEVRFECNKFGRDTKEKPWNKTANFVKVFKGEEMFKKDTLIWKGKDHREVKK